MKKLRNDRLAKNQQKAVILGINTSSNKNSVKDGTFKVHHYREDYDPDKFIETSQIIIKKKDQLIALDKYVFANNPSNRQKKSNEKKVNIIGINPESQKTSKITSSHRRRVRNPNPKPGQVTATAVLMPDGLYQQISSTDGEYVTIDSSTPLDSNGSNNNIVQRQSKARLDSSFESSDIFKKNLSQTKSIQAEIESSFVDSNVGISPRNPHGLWKDNSQNENIEVEYEYVDEEEEKEEKKEEKIVAKKEVSINNNIDNQNEEEIIEYEIIEEEEEEEEAEPELEQTNNNQNPQVIEEEEEYEYIEEEEEEKNEDKDQLIHSNSLGDVQPLNVFQNKQVTIDANNIENSKNQNSDYDEENDYATEENVNTQSFINSEQNKPLNKENNEEEEAEIEETKMEEANNQNEKEEKEVKDMKEVKDNTNDENIQHPIQQENQIHDSSNSKSNSKKQVNFQINNTDENIEATQNKANDNNLNTSSSNEKKPKFVDNGVNMSESINVNDIQSSTANQYDPKDSEPTVSIFEEYVFADEKEKEKEKEKEETQKPKLSFADQNQNFSKVNDSSFGFNDSQMQERDEKQISNTLNNLVKNRNQIMKSEIESTEININVVDNFNQSNNNNNNLKSPSKNVKKLFLSPTNAVESRPGTQEKVVNKNVNEPSDNKKEKKQTNLKSQFNFEPPINVKQQQNPHSDGRSDKTNEAGDDQTITTCDLDMSNIQKSPPARENKSKSYNSDEYYSHEYYTTMETNEISNRRGRNSVSKNNKNNGKNSKKNSDNDSYYSYSYYSDNYTYSYDPSTIESKSKKFKHHHRGHSNKYTYEYATNTTYDTMDRSVRPSNDKSSQLPIELQKQIQQQLQQQIQLNMTPQSNQTTPYSVKLRIKDSQRKLFNFENGKPPRFILKTVSEDGIATPHNIEFVLETKPSSEQTPVQSTNTSVQTTQSPESTSPVSPIQQKQKNQSVQFEIPQIIQSGPHKGLIKRRIKKSEKAKRESERNLMQVEEKIRNLEQMIVEQDQKKLLQQQQQQQQPITETSVEITNSTVGLNEGQNSPFAKSPSKRGKGKRLQKAGNNNDRQQQLQPRNQPSAVSRSSPAILSSSTNSPNKRHYYDENGNPVLVEISDPTGRPVFRRIARSSASSSIKHGNSNPSFKGVPQSLPRPVKGRNIDLNVEQPKQQQQFGTPKRDRKKFSLNDESDEDDKNNIKKSPARNVRINHQLHINNDDIDDSDSDIDSDDDENFKDFNNKNIENQMEFGKVFRSRKAPHIKREKFQNPQIHLKPRNVNLNNASPQGSTPLKKAVLDSDSDSDSDYGENPFLSKNMSPDSKRRKREELTKEIEELRQLLPDQVANENNKEEIEKYNSKKNSNRKPPSIPSSQRKQPKRFVNEEYDPFEDFDSNLDNLQKSPYDPSQNLNNNINNRLNRDRPPPVQLNNPGNRQPSDGSTSSLTRRRKMPKITVEIPEKGSEGQAEIFRRHYENASPEKAPQNFPEKNREANEYEDDSAPLNASTKNTFKNQDEKEGDNNSSNFSSKKRVRKRIRVSVHDGSRSPAPHSSSNPLKESKLSSNQPNTNSNSNSPSKKQMEAVKPFLDTFKENLRQKLNSLDDDYDDNDDVGNQKNADNDSMTIGAMNPVQAKRLEESKKLNEIAPLTPPVDVDLNQSSSMLSNAPPPSPKNQDVEIVIRDGKRKRKKKVSLSPGSHSSKNSGTRGNVIRSHHLKDSEKYPQNSPPPSVLSSIANENDLDD